jgi:hypothetical protein
LHAMLFEKISGTDISLKYSLPPVSLSHIRQLTTGTGIIQFSKINQPDLDSGYTLDDNARALVAMCMHYELTREGSDLVCMQTYLDFIKYCMQPAGNFLNYVDKNGQFTEQNKTNLDDANGRAVWALGYVISQKSLLPEKMVSVAETILQNALPRLEEIHSARAMAFAIKGIYYYTRETVTTHNVHLIETMANRLLGMFTLESAENWNWFEGYLTYANSILPEAMVYAWLLTGDFQYEYVARKSLDFLLSSIFNENGIEVISNKGWLNKGQKAGRFGEQPIDVAYTVMTLSKFYEVFRQEKYLLKMKTAFNWFLGNNRLNQIVYNPCTGGCYDGLEEYHVNLNQGAESALSYLMARLTIEKYNFIPQMSRAPIKTKNTQVTREIQCCDLPQI